VDQEQVVIALTRDQALVLSDWLFRNMGTERLDSLIDEDRAVWSPIYAISGTLETSLAEVFAADYGQRLARARSRLVATLGDVDGT
jgi:hypothetical protein